MTTTVPSAALVVTGPVFTEPEQLALAGFSASCTGLTRQAYMLDLRQHATWCHQRHVAPVRRPASRHRRLRPRPGRQRQSEVHGVAAARHDRGILQVRGRGRPACSLPGRPLRVSEAVGADIEALSVQRGHRTVSITRKGGKKAVVPLAPRTARAIDLAIGERCEGPIFLTAAGIRLDRHGAGRVVRRVARRAGLTKTIGPHTLRHAVTAALDAGVPLRDVQEAASHADPRTTMR
jgi:integrase/recombinase XerD